MNFCPPITLKDAKKFASIFGLFGVLGGKQN
jgi:hypothetical protein